MKVQPIHALWSSHFISTRMSNGIVYIVHENYKRDVPKSTIHNSSNCKHPICPLTVKWVNKVLYIHIMEDCMPMIRN